MIKSFIDKYKFSKIAAIEWHWLSEEHYVLKGVIGEKKKDAINIVEEFDGIGLSSLPEYLDVKTPIVLVVTGYGVLHKPISKEPSDASKLLNLALPNVEQSQFYYELNKQGSQSIVSILKQERLKIIYEAFRSADYSVLSTRLGLYQIQEILPILDLGYQIYDIGNYLLQADSEQIANTESKDPAPSKVKLTIGEDQLSMDQLNPFATLWQYFIGEKEPSYNNELIEAGHEDSIYRRIFQRVLWGGLIGLFILLLANTFYFSNYSEALELQTAQLSSNKQQLKYLDSLNVKFNNIKVLKEKSTLLKNSKTSFYSDEIGSTIPKEIFLDQLILFPSKESSRNKLQETYDFNPLEIRIEGSTQNSFAINEWISALKKLEWINEVDLLPFSRKSKGLAQFEIKLSLK